MPTPDEGPHRVGPYRLLKPIGAGGMGEVWLAEDPRLGRQVAVKRIRHDRAQGATIQARFRQEAQAVARLSHPGIVQIHDLVEEEDSNSIVFEYVTGSTVTQLVQKGPLDLALTCNLGRQVARALAAAHDEGLIHRDLKGENVIVTSDEHGRPLAKILDFGLVKDLGNVEATALTADAAVLGTFRSMAPEQASGAPLDHRADLFSLGVLLYEMVAGRSPFVGATAADTVDRLLRRDPEPLENLHPTAPKALTSLVARLLEKDPRRRPAHANDVANAFEHIERLVSTEDLIRSEVDRPGEDQHDGDSWWLNAPTSAEEHPPTTKISFFGHGSWRRWALGAILLLALTLLTAAISYWAQAPKAPLRVAILPTQISTGPSDLHLPQAAINTTLALTRTLVGLEGISAVDPMQLGDLHGSLLELGRAVAAAEIVTAAISPEGSGARLELRRTRVSDGSVLWSDSLPVPIRPENVLLLADAVAGRLRQSFAGHAQKEGQPKLDVRPQDYEAFLQIHRDIESGSVPWDQELERLEKILATSPDFFEAHLLAADTARNLFGDSGDPTQLAKARDYLRQLQRLAPEDLRTRAAEVRLLLAASRGEQEELATVEAAVIRLKKDFPGTPEPLELQSVLAEMRGDLSSAIDLMKTAVDRQGTWRQLYRLAHLEIRGSRSEDARLHLRQLMDLAPGNSWVQAKLAQQELLYGDAAIAEKLFLELTTENPHRSDLNNLGLARLLQGRLSEARDSFRQALALDPHHLSTRLNLADTEADLGKDQQARELYEGILASFDAAEQKPSSTDAMMRAQCLARLGRPQDAVDLALRTLREDPEDAEIAFAGALVFSLSGETVSALASAREALRLGVAPRWFSIPGFRALHEVPAFQQLLEGQP